MPAAFRIPCIPRLDLGGANPYPRCLHYAATQQLPTALSISADKFASGSPEGRTVTLRACSASRVLPSHVRLVCPPLLSFALFNASSFEVILSSRAPLTNFLAVPFWVKQFSCRRPSQFEWPQRCHVPTWSRAYDSNSCNQFPQCVKKNFYRLYKVKNLFFYSFFSSRPSLFFFLSLLRNIPCPLHPILSLNLLAISCNYLASGWCSNDNCASNSMDTKF